jgi:hypothetical protein
MSADVYSVSRAAAGRSIIRAIAASALSQVKKSSTAERICRQAWPRDEAALLLPKAAVSPTKTTDFPGIGHDRVAAFKSIAPGSAVLNLFDATQQQVRPHRSEHDPRPDRQHADAPGRVRGRGSACAIRAICV